MALMLILLLDGLWAGVRAQVTRYEDEIGAQLYVVAPGARSLFADGSNIPLTTVDTVQAPHGRRRLGPHRCAASSPSSVCTAARSRPPSSERSRRARWTVGHGRGTRSGGR